MAVPNRNPKQNANKGNSDNYRRNGDKFGRKPAAWFDLAQQNNDISQKNNELTQKHRDLSQKHRDLEQKFNQLQQQLEMNKENMSRNRPEQEYKSAETMPAVASNINNTFGGNMNSNFGAENNSNKLQLQNTRNTNVFNNPMNEMQYQLLQLAQLCNQNQLATPNFTAPIDMTNSPNAIGNMHAAIGQINISSPQRAESVSHMRYSFESYPYLYFQCKDDGVRYIFFNGPNFGLPARQRSHHKYHHNANTTQTTVYYSPFGTGGDRYTLFVRNFACPPAKMIANYFFKYKNANNRAPNKIPEQMIEYIRNNHGQYLCTSNDNQNNNNNNNNNYVNDNDEFDTEMEMMM